MSADLFENPDADRDERRRVDAADKRFATLAASFANAGCVFVIVDGDAPFVVTRWGGLCREFASLEAVDEFLAELTGKL